MEHVQLANGCYTRAIWRNVDRQRGNRKGGREREGEREGGRKREGERERERDST